MPDNGRRRPNVLKARRTLVLSHGFSRFYCGLGRGKNVFNITSLICSLALQLIQTDEASVNRRIHTHASSTRYDTKRRITDGNMTPLFQFIDTHVNKPFQLILREKWADWIVY